MGDFFLMELHDSDPPDTFLFNFTILTGLIFFLLPSPKIPLKWWPISWLRSNCILSPQGVIGPRIQAFCQPIHPNWQPRVTNY